MIKAFSREPHKDRKAVKIRAHGPSIVDLERAERLREAMEALHEVNKKVPVIVEGKKDAAALRSLGLTGEVITLHRGSNLYEFCEDISERFERVVILLDWDDKGESLNKTISAHLRGLWEEFAGFREVLKILCQKDIKDVESIPKLLRNLEGDETARQ
ncbi:MAG TPA: toprim domain-containing protein [Thermodesulfovibrionales bacterium]|nr:toprim domain-containing protein [Thermodesulfovibrionales bacterium]